MNTANVKAVWNWLPPRRKRTKRHQLGFVLHLGVREAGLPPPVANARARFEHDARQALRDWLMV